MNELLEDFAAKAQLEAEWATPQGLEWFDAFKQKFAELIVQECIAKIEEAAEHSPELYGVALDIQDHFGIDEIEQ